MSVLDKRQQHDLIVLDFSKAFDRVPHERLLRKMDHYGIRGNTLEWIRAFLTDRVQQVTVEGATSDSIQVLSGVPQGTVLGPLLFLVFINDLPDCVESGIRLLADDCILYRLAILKKMHPKCDIGGQISKLLYHYLFYVILTREHQNFRNKYWFKNKI